MAYTGDSVLSVSAVNQYIKTLFDTSDILSGISVRGEISNFKYHTSGHMYFSLKDEGGLIRSVMFRSAVNSLTFVPREGMRIIADGSISVYTRDGQYQLYITRMRPDGIGSLFQAFEALKEKLGAEGLFDERNKKKLPPYPSRIGIVTSRTGAAIRDIVNILSRRYPIAEILLRPAEVQGIYAPASIMEGIHYFETVCPVDVIIVGRGGGSFEDLCAFNDENLAHAIHQAKTPIISAVGHETDFTICDFVADLRAPTPSAAAELAVPDKEELYQLLGTAMAKIRSGFRNRCQHDRNRVNSICHMSWYKRPESILSFYRQVLQQAEDKLAVICKEKMTQHRKNLDKTKAFLKAMDPHAVLKRGYAIPLTASGGALTSCHDATSGDELDLIMHDGRLSVEVKSKRGNSKP